MSSRARPFAFRLGRAVFALAAAAAFAGCAQDTAPVAIVPERREFVTPAPRPESQGAKAATFTIDYPPLGFKIAIALPEEGHLCILLPESAQDPTSCMGLDPGALVDALPEGPERPFGAAYARMGDWSYIVMLTPIGTGIEAKEDIDELVDGAVKSVHEVTSLAPTLLVDAPGQKFDLLRVQDVPVVKFRIDAPEPVDSPSYDLATTLFYAAFGGKSAMISFITSPNDADKMMPYAEATIRSLVLPPREAPERFGKPRSELNQQSTRTGLILLGLLLLAGGLLFLWLARTKPAAPQPASPAAAPSKKNGAPSAKENAPSDDEADKKGE